ncbi:NAD(P)-binding protein [Laetiporus sulphureus 93-53]|uniref:NAD(P)-binding protein n=1 Tax=Laetiporus sulphureus 93-53 TaxID=1314785 RepID=A0A165FTB5_9APHY|nr:NAD(P)-binding protein [Laetiporus sulphureus 93-53]KZT09382.1 NAD(P)-binding protein [Laetiporus sulphureus 93-53]
MSTHGSPLRRTHGVSAVNNSQPLNTIALFGARGMLGSVILSALLDSPVQGYHPRITVFLRPGKPLKRNLADHPQVLIIELDYFEEGTALAQHLRGVDAIISALSGPGISAQYRILNAAIEAGVRRFYPSEYGFHQAYRAPGDPGGRIMPLWDEKERFAEHLKLHPAVEAGNLEYTFIGVGDLYDQPTEPFWCAWTSDRESYEVPIVGDPNARADWSCTRDVARYVVATLSKPAISANAYLNFPSETLSQHAMVELFRKYARGRKVDVRHFSMDEAHRFIARPQEAPQQIAMNSSFPVDFYFVVKSIQGSGTFRRSRWECHWDLFPEVKRTTFEEYMRERFGDPDEMIV